MGLGVGLRSHGMPSLPDGLNRKLGRVMVSPNADPTVVRRQVIHPRGDSWAVRQTQPVLDLDCFRLPLGLSLPSALGEGPAHCCLLGVSREHRVARPLAGLDLLLEG